MWLKWIENLRTNNFYPRTDTDVFLIIDKKIKEKYELNPSSGLKHSMGLLLKCFPNFIRILITTLKNFSVVPGIQIGNHYLASVPIL